MSQTPLPLFRKVFTLGDAISNGISRRWVLGFRQPQIFLPRVRDTLRLY